jgi:dCTP deaminase
MILVDRQIHEAVKSREIGIKNFSTACVQPASYDLRIGPLIYSSQTDPLDKPIDLSSNGGAYRLPPYGHAILMTYETLSLPPKIIGRFGLKSGFARRGLLASTGPQVDPGFKGKLFISLLNLFPRSQVLRYKDPFLSIEFHTLDEAPEKTYEGPYQKREDISPEILEDLIQLEGLNLSQVQSQFSELAQHVKQWSALASRFDEFLADMKEHTKAIDALTRQLPSAVRSGSPSEKEIYAREISLDEAIEEITELFSEKIQLFYSDIAEALHLDYSTVVEACRQLQKKGLIEEIPSGKQKTKKPRKQH